MGKAQSVAGTGVKPSNAEPALKESINAIGHCVKQNIGRPLEQYDGDRNVAVTKAIQTMMGNPAYAGNITALQNVQKSGKKVERLIAAAGKNANRALVASYLAGENRNQRKAFLNAWQKANGTAASPNGNGHGSVETARQQMERLFEQSSGVPTVNLTINNLSLELAAQVLGIAGRNTASKRAPQETISRA